MNLNTLIVWSFVLEDRKYTARKTKQSPDDGNHSSPTTLTCFPNSPLRNRGDVSPSRLGPNPRKHGPRDGSTRCLRVFHHTAPWAESTSRTRGPGVNGGGGLSVGFRGPSRGRVQGRRVRGHRPCYL